MRTFTAPVDRNVGLVYECRALVEVWGTSMNSTTVSRATREKASRDLFVLHWGIRNFTVKIHLKVEAWDWMAGLNDDDVEARLLIT
jgi:hypothetical protein